MGFSQAGVAKPVRVGKVPTDVAGITGWWSVPGGSFMSPQPEGATSRVAALSDICSGNRQMTNVATDVATHPTFAPTFQYDVPGISLERPISGEIRYLASLHDLDYTTGFTILMVMKHGTSGQPGAGSHWLMASYGTDAAPRQGIMLAGNDVLGIRAAVGTASGIAATGVAPRRIDMTNLGKPFVIGARFDGSVLQSYSQGTWSAPLSVSPLFSGEDTWFLNQPFDEGGQPWRANPKLVIADVATWHRGLTDMEIAEVSSYWVNRYGLTLA